MVAPARPEPVQVAPAAKPRPARKVARELGLKLCPKCKVLKPLSDYYRSAAGAGGLDWLCKSCAGPIRAQRAKAWYEANKERQAERSRDYKRHERNGVPATPEQIEEIEAGELHACKVRGAWMVLPTRRGREP